MIVDAADGSFDQPTPCVACGAGVVRTSQGPASRGPELLDPHGCATISRAMRCTMTSRQRFAIALAIAALAPACDSTGGSDPCAHVDCSSRGYCYLAAQGAPACNCLPGYHAVGLSCVVNNPENPCDGVDCSGRGVCREEAGAPVCDCVAGWRPDPDNPTRCVPATEDGAVTDDAAAEDAALDHPPTDVDDGDAEVPFTCGDGRVETGEECDDGNSTAGDGCETNCRLSCHDSADCNDRDPCTHDACSDVPGGRACVHSIAVGLPCDDGDPCTGGESCQADGSCGGGTPTCVCRTDADCVPFEDGNLCNGTLVCASNRCLIDPTTLVTCDPSGDTACRRNTCNPATGTCAPADVADGTSCDDGLWCNGNEVCRSGVCTPGSNPCPVAGCVTGCDEVAHRCVLASSSTVCRPAAGPCDAEEYCSGTSSSCPADAYRSSSTVCRPALSVCDVAENCTGSSPSCPADRFQSGETICRPATGPCDITETCTGSSASCPPDVVERDGMRCGLCMICESARCVNTPRGTDPYNECDGFRCSDYIYGWSGRNCVRFASSTADNGTCNGSGGCAGLFLSCTGTGAAISGGTCGSDGCRNTSATSPCLPGAIAPASFSGPCDFEGGPCYCDCSAHGCPSSYRCSDVDGTCVLHCL